MLTQHTLCKFALYAINYKIVEKNRALVCYSIFRTTFGELAQLGERMTGSHEVRGSIPLFSTTNSCGGICRRFFSYGLMAQRLAQGTHNPWVGGSNPSGPTKYTCGEKPFGFLAISFTETLYRSMIRLLNLYKRRVQ